MPNCSIIRPSLEYASCVWDPYQTNQIQELEKVQRRAARFVFNSYTDTTPGHVTNLVQQLNWEPLESRRTKNRLTMAYKIQNSLVDVNHNRYYIPADSRTRGGLRFRQQRTNKEQYRQSFFPRSIREWNILPDAITTAPTLEDFKARITTLPVALNDAASA